MPLRKNAIVFYPTYGVCKICDISQKLIGSDTIECYHIHPLYEKNCSVLVPTTNKKAISRMRRVLSRQEMSTLLPKHARATHHLVENATARKKRYEEILESGDRQAAEQLGQNALSAPPHFERTRKKTASGGEQSLQTAEKMLHDEACHVLGIEHEQALDFILEQIQKKR